MTEPEEVLGDRATERFDAVSADAVAGPVGETSTDWIVILGDDGSPLGATRREGVSALGPTESMRAALRSARSTVVADAAMSIDGLLDSPAFRDAAPEVVIALGEDGVQGLWAGTDLAAEALSHASRFGADWSLPGGIMVPKIVRICAHAAGDRRCSASMQFPERPATLPPCPDPDKLGTHSFVW